ncbi:protein DBF4 homolog A-like [Ruditapes philippinarum]|uniref:protein DBF4 homolog A-like n=1 Tax=Ruditapes philippinarum TaxID=129788 RepID=UPI00295A88CB|nr:protein DBF4 homolog A-like [Ruditapes philippinarum]
MKPKSSGLRARRSLSFEERPYAGKTFYLDVKSASAKSKISQRIQNLGGQIEDFLSKDLTLLITDKSSTKHSKDDYSQKQTTKNVPLSRGQALLLKASANHNCDANNNSNGLLQSAAKLGLRIETPVAFLRDSAKHLQKLKAETSRMDTSMSGMSPITWDSEKENGPVIKVEDEDGLYRPLF